MASFSNDFHQFLQDIFHAQAFGYRCVKFPQYLCLIGLIPDNRIADDMFPHFHKNPYAEHKNRRINHHVIIFSAWKHLLHSAS